MLFRSGVSSCVKLMPKERSEEEVLVRGVSPLGSGRNSVTMQAFGTALEALSAALLACSVALSGVCRLTEAETGAEAVEGGCMSQAIG